MIRVTPTLLSRDEDVQTAADLSDLCTAIVAEATHRDLFIFHAVVAMLLQDMLIAAEHSSDPVVHANMDKLKSSLLDVIKLSKTELQAKYGNMRVIRPGAQN